MGRGPATLTGFGAVLLWALLALLTVGTGRVPPFQLNAMCFAVATAVGLVWTVASGRRLTEIGRIGLPAALTGILGLFGYHASYFTALRLAPPAEASLIAYLWPLLIVLFSGLLPGERLRAGHIGGAVISFGGAALIVGRGGAGFDAAALPGYAAALACALIWSGYSVLSRRFGRVPTTAVTLFCAAASVLSALVHLAVETTVWPAGFGGWLSTLLLGLGPVGLAFYLWDIGVKRGDIQMLGVASYAAPFLSTLVLIAAGKAEASGVLLLAALMVAGGAALAALPGRR